MDPSDIGPYRIRGELGRGGMGTVLEAEVTQPVAGLEVGTLVALKVIHPHLLATGGYYERFLREADIGRSVEHTNVVRCYDRDRVEVDGEPQHFLVMEYVEGKTLRALLEDLGRVPEELCLHIAGEIAKGLAAVHEAGAVHRDLKPENVLITGDHVVKLMDLGVARLRDEAVRLSPTGTFVGSLAYAAPEQLSGPRTTIDGRTDLYALGVVLYELATGQNPFQADGLNEVLRRVLHEMPAKAGRVNPQLSPFFEELLHALLAKSADDRLASATELGRVIEQGESSALWLELAAELRRATRRPLRRIRIPRETELYGREAEVARLREAFEEAKAGRGQVVLLAGEAGIGKTRLVDELVGRLEHGGEDVNFLFGSYPPGGAATAAGAFSTAYREHFGGETLEATLATTLEKTPALVPAFAALLRGEPPPRDAIPLTKDSMQTLFVHATRALADERPTVVLIDDLHFAPEEGRALFASLAQALPADRVLLIGTMRPGVPEAWIAEVEHHEHVARHTLSRLGAKDLSQLLEDAFHSRRLADELGMRIARKSDGNPFFVFEILRGLRDGQLISRRPDGTWVTTQVIREIRVPSSVADLVQARISALGEADKNMLDVAACCGFRFDPFVVAHAIDRPPLPVMQRLAWLERRHQLVRSAGSVFEFDHHQVQEVLSAGLPDPLRAMYHQRLAAALEARVEARGGELGGALAVDLSEHALAGGDIERARRFLEPALDHLHRGYLNDQAVRLAQRALLVEGLLEGGDRCDVLLRLIRHLDILGRRKEQERALAEALPLAERLKDDRRAGEVARAQASLLGHLGRSDDAITCLEAALERATRAGEPSLRLMAITHLAAVHVRARRHDEGRRRCEEALALAEELQDRKTESIVAGYLGVIANALGEFEEAHRQFARRLETARELGDRIGQGVSAANIGWVYHCEGRVEEACEWHERGLVIARELGFRQMEAAVLGNLGSETLQLGRPEEAQDHYARFSRITREIGDARGIASSRAHMGALALWSGRLAAARTHLESLLKEIRPFRDPMEEASGKGNLGMLLMWLGRPEEGRVLLQEALETARASNTRRQQGWWELGLGELAERVNDFAPAAEHLEGGLDVLWAIGDRVGMATGRLARGRLRVRRGDARGATRDLDAVLEVADDLGPPALRVLAAAWRARLPGGDPASARATLAEFETRLDAIARLEAHVVLWRADGRAEDLEAARALLEESLQHAPEGDRDAMRENVHLFRTCAGLKDAPDPEDGSAAS